MFTHSDFGKSVARSADWRVFAEGHEIPVYTCRISAYPFNRWWPGHQRQMEQSETVSFINLVSDEAVNLTVESLTKSTDGRVMIKPYSKEILPEIDDKHISFTLKENGAYVLEINDYHGLLYVFNNKPVFCEDKEAVTHYFGPGVHTPGNIILQSGESVYVDKDAYVYGNIFAEKAENVRVFGNGVMDDSNEKRTDQHYMGAQPYGNIKLMDCKNVRLEGVGFTNSAIWCVNVFHCEDVTIDGIRVFGQWRYNTDGVDIVNCNRVTLKNSFVHSFDDTVVIKGLDQYGDTSNTDILTENCVLWCDWGNTCEIGLETSAPEYDNIVFRNCDLLRAGGTACDIQNGDYAWVHNVTFEDIRIELESFYTASLIQKSDEHVYDQQDTVEIARIFKVTNYRFREWYSFLELPETKPVYPEGDKRYAGVSDVTVKNITIYCDPTLLERFGRECAKIKIKKYLPAAEYKNFTLENVVINGKKLTKEDMDLQLINIEKSVLSVK